MNEDKIIMYSTECPKCNILKEKLDNKNINYNICNDINYMKEKHILSVPVLEINGELLQYGKAIKWVNNL